VAPSSFAGVRGSGATNGFKAGAIDAA